MIFNQDNSDLINIITQDTLHDTKTAIAADPSSIDAIKNYDVGIYRVAISGTTIFPHGYGLLEILKGQDYATARFSTMNVANPRTWRVEWNTSSGSWYNNVWTDEQKYVKDSIAYAANDTFSVNSSLVLCGFINAERKIFYFDVPLDKSTENINSVSVTTMTGFILGINGRVGVNSSDDFTTSTFSLSCAKQGNTHIRIALSRTDSTAFYNASADTPVTYFGSLTLKFA